MAVGVDSDAVVALAAESARTLPAQEAARNVVESGGLARELIEDMLSYADIWQIEHLTTPLDASVRDYALEQLERFLSDPPRPTNPPPPERPNPLRTTIGDERCGECSYEVSQYNPEFWNATNVVRSNNCYNYARNWRTGTFAQPGRAHGAQAATMACPDVTNAAIADGLRRRCDCLADEEYPRRLMALVVAPGSGDTGDYHWYRHQRGDFWGHKPGHTPARNWDNSNNIIVSPETCNRGPYTDFCGYFYAGRSVLIS